MGSLYVIGEDAAKGPVKIGMTFDTGGKVGRGGLNVGNWRQLVLLERLDVDTATIRWREWLTHHRLRHRHVRGEWFDVRELAGADWKRFLDEVWRGTSDGLHDIQLGFADHEIVGVSQPTAPFRHFLIECSCGEIVDGEPANALPSALTTYAVGHLKLSRQHPLVEELRVEPSHARFTPNRYDGS
jgi:hypothetical protein